VIEQVGNSKFLLSSLTSGIGEWPIGIVIPLKLVFPTAAHSNSISSTVKMSIRPITRDALSNSITSFGKNRIREWYSQCIRISGKVNHFIYVHLSINYLVAMTFPNGFIWQFQMTFSRAYTATLYTLGPFKPVYTIESIFSSSLRCWLKGNFLAPKFEDEEGESVDSKPISP
jgi:hypothetical protein